MRRIIMIHEVDFMFYGLDISQSGCVSTDKKLDGVIGNNQAKQALEQPVPVSGPVLFYRCVERETFAKAL